MSDTRNSGAKPESEPNLQPQPEPGQTPRPLCVGVIGCGYWGAKLVRNFQELPQSNLLAAADLDEERRAHLRRQYPELGVCADHREILSDPGIEAVVIATPPSTHAALAIEAMEAGKHVLVEKPLATSMRESEAMIAVARKTGRTLMVGHTFVYNTAVEKLRELVASGELGNLLYMRATRVNLGIFQPDINVVWDLAPHDLSILMHLLGAMPIAVRAQGESYVQPGIVDVAWLTLDFPGGIMANVHVSWLDPCKIRRVTVVGDRKMAVYDDVAPLDKITLYDRGVEMPPHTDTFGEFQLSYRYGDVLSPRLQWEEPLKRECAHFVACARSGTAPLSGGAAGLQVVAVLEAADRSLAADGARVEVEFEPQRDGVSG